MAERAAGDAAREEVLRRVRSALGGPRGPRTGAAPPRVPRPGPRAGTDPAELASRFAERVEDYRAVVTRVDGDEAVGDAVGAALDDAGARGDVLVPEGFGWRLPDDVRVRAEDPAAPLAAGVLDGIAAVVTGATLGIAETGTIVLAHGPGEGRRAVTLVPDVHVCVVREDQVVDDVPDAFALLDPARPTTWISGPSATSDIELDRVEGVHGPRTLHVVLVGRAASAPAGV